MRTDSEQHLYVQGMTSCHSPERVCKAEDFQAIDRGGSLAPGRRAKGMHLDAQCGAGEGEAAAKSRTFLDAASALG